MNKPASELIALADLPRIIETIENYGFACEAGPLTNCGEWRHLKRLAHQSGSERPGVDALREALVTARECIWSGGNTISTLKTIDTALATPPAQPAPANESSTSSDGGVELLRIECDALRAELKELRKDKYYDELSFFKNRVKELERDVVPASSDWRGCGSLPSGESDPVVTQDYRPSEASTHGKPDGALRQLEPWQFELDEVIGHLGAAIHQSVASDDQIIMDHVKAAHEIAKIVRRKA